LKALLQDSILHCRDGVWELEPQAVFRWGPG